MTPGAEIGDPRARDAEARRLAQTEFGRPVVVEAGAGTGKTATLVARIVAWSLGPGWERTASRLAKGDRPPEPQRIAPEVLRRMLAITFTEAAAAEMAVRVGQALLDVERGQPPEWICAEALPSSIEDLRSRARALLGALDQLAVRTIHAFCRRLLVQHPLEAGLHPYFAVDADESEQKAIVREVLEQALPRILAESDDALVLARAGRGPAQVEETLLFLQRQGVPATALSDDPLAPARIAELRDELSEVLGTFLRTEDGRLGSVGGRAPKLRETLQRIREMRDRLPGLATRADLESLLAWVGEAWDGNELGRLREWSKGRFGSTAEAAAGAAAGAIAEAAGPLHRALRHLRCLDLELLEAGRRLLQPLAARVEGEMRARGVETFPALLRDARDLLVRHPALCRGVRAQIDQLLVDEFQDTDRIQCRILAELVLAAPLEECPGLFLVGDPKQSIYGWRNADLAAYDEFVGRVEDAGGVRLQLVVNFRSAPPILAEVERVVAPVMREQPGLQPAFQLLLPDPRRKDREARGFDRDPWAPVEHWVSWAWDPASRKPARTRASQAADLEARALAVDVARLHASHGVPWKEIGLLFRGVGDLETYLNQLRRAGVPYAVEGDRSYFRRREIIEAAALVRCVLDPNDHLALLAFLRSAVVGVPDAALIPLWSRELPDLASALHRDRTDVAERLRTAVAEAAQDVPRDVPGIERVSGWEDNLLAALRALAALRSSFEEDPADVFVEKLRSLLLVEATEAARYLGAYRVANLDHFFRDLLTALAHGERDPRAILRAMRQDVADRREAEEGRPKEAAEDAVQVLTIHKAKGLDFGHVYVLQLNKGRGRGAEERAEERDDGGFEYRLFGAPTLGYARVEERRLAVEEAERVRTLYVALTRARERLVVAGLHPEHAASRSDESHVALLQERRGEPPDLGAAMRELGRAGTSCRVDCADARWVFPALPAFASGGVASSGRARNLFDPAAVESAAMALERHRALAAQHDQRPFGGAVSAQAHEVQLEWWREGRLGDDAEEEGRPRAPQPGDRDQAVARAVGTAVHRALERLDPRASATGELARRRAELRDELLRALAGDAVDAALARAEELLDRFAAGPLLARLRELADHVVARELPVLLPPDTDGGCGPVGFVAGAVDLLYRDPDSAEWVVADYKTDRVESEAEIAARAAVYAAQGAGYLRAVREALDLPCDPRFELWFLHAGRIEVVESSGGRSS